LKKLDLSTILPEAARVLRCWFGDESEASYPRLRDEWFRKREEFDVAISDNFKALYECGARGELEGWRGTPLGALAYVILFDQFSRNMFRGSAQAFAFDSLALAAAEQSIANGYAAQIPPPMRMFLYMPFEHSEARADQERSVALFQSLADEAPELTDMLEYANRHRDVIMRFGRFPHRNPILGRLNTLEEEEFLKQPGSWF
jgi:uncharacterized protein (DUF924 family)